MRWVRRILIGLAAVVALAFATVYGGSEWIIRQSRAVPLESIAVPHDAATLSEGGRLAKVEGCRDCHGRDGQGQVLAEGVAIGRIVAPSFASISARYSDAELARAVRHGVRKDGSTLWVMPSQAYRHIADEDMARIIAWVRTRKPGASDVKVESSFGPMLRGLMLGGALQPSVQPAAVAEARRSANVGRYYYDAVCSACHALDKPLPAHDGNGVAPALADAAAAYDLDAFQHMLRTGEGAGKRNLGLMSQMSREAFSAMTPEEMAAVHAWLKGESEKLAAR